MAPMLGTSSPLWALVAGVWDFDPPICSKISNTRRELSETFEKKLGLAVAVSEICEKKLGLAVAVSEMCEKKLGLAVAVSEMCEKKLGLAVAVEEDAPGEKNLWSFEGSIPGGFEEHHPDSVGFGATVVSDVNQYDDMPKWQGQVEQ